MQVNVLLQGKQSLALDFGADDTIQHVKMKIEEEEDIPQLMQRVIFAGVTQDDGRLLTALAPGPLITLSVVASDTIYNVIVVNHKGKRHNVDTRASDTIFHVKSKTPGYFHIIDQVKVKGYDNEHRTLWDYYIRPGETLNIAVRAGIKIHYQGGVHPQVGSFEVLGNDTIEDIQATLAGLRIPYDQQRFIVQCVRPRSRSRSREQFPSGPPRMLDTEFQARAEQRRVHAMRGPV